MPPHASAVAAFCLLVVWSVPRAASAAQTAPPPEEPREDCTRAESIPLDIKAFRRNPERYGGRCVHVRGIIYSRGFVRDTTELYEQVTDRDKKPMIAVYGKAGAADQHLWGARTYADIVAYTYTCEKLYGYAKASAERATAEAKARGEDGVSIPFVTGRCHYDGGPVLWVSDWQPLADMPTRLYDKAAARKYRNMDEVHERWRHYDEVKRIVTTWFDLVRTHDSARLTGFLADTDVFSLENHRQIADALVDPAQSPVSFPVGRSAAPSVALFLQRRERGDKGRDYLAYGCVCREPDCHDRWPFHSADTDTSSSPAPYFCISVGAVGGEPPHLEEYPRPRLGRD